MKRFGVVCLAVIMSIGLCGCGKQEPKEPNLTGTPQATDVQKEKGNYVGKYIMRQLPPRTEEMKKFLEEMGEQPDSEGEKLLKDGLSPEDLGIKSELLCIEIKDNDDVYVCIGGFAAKKAKLVKEYGKAYIKLNEPCFDGFTDKILLGEKEVDGKSYLTFENENGKRVYFNQLKSDKIVSNIEINDYRDFTAKGIFRLDPEVTLKQTGKDPYMTWGSGLRMYGASMKINEDGTGIYSIGVAEYVRFRLEKSWKSGLTSMTIIDEQGLQVEHEGPTFTLDAVEIDGENYLALYGNNASYWRCVNDDQIVFEDQDGVIGIWVQANS